MYVTKMAKQTKKREREKERKKEIKKKERWKKTCISGIPIVVPSLAKHVHSKTTWNNMTAHNFISVQQTWTTPKITTKTTTKTKRNTYKCYYITSTKYSSKRRQCVDLVLISIPWMKAHADHFFHGKLHNKLTRIKFICVWGGGQVLKTPIFNVLFEMWSSLGPKNCGLPISDDASSSWTGS